MKRSILLLLIILCAAYDAIAGGPLGAVGATPRRYAASSFPLAYRTDQGALGRFTNATAVAISNYAFQQWDNVATAARKKSRASTSRTKSRCKSADGIARAKSRLASRRLSS